MILKSVAQTLAVCGMAIFTGVMLNIGLTLGAYWKSLSPAEFLDWFSTNSHFIARTIPLITLPTLIALIASIWLNWDNSSVRNLWLLSLLCMLGIAAITFAWHLPTNSLFANKDIPLDDVPARLNEWLQLHAIRVTLGLTGSILGIIAIQK